MAKRYNQHIEISNQLYDDLKKYGKNFCIGMATQVRDDLTKSAAVAVESFYQDYRPFYYQRNYYNFRKKSFKKFYENKHQQIIRGGVELSPEHMDSLYQDPVSEVFDMFYAGYHGVASGFGGVGINRQTGAITEYEPYSFTPVPIMRPSPLEIIQEYRDTIINHIDWYADRYGYTRASHDTYDTLIIGG